LKRVRQSLAVGEYTLYSVTLIATRNGVSVFNTTSIRARDNEEAQQGAEQMVREAYPYDDATYAVSVNPIALEMFAE
jgi:hypothetical protein